MTRIILSIVLLCVITSCREETRTPKPRAYPRVEYPEKKYVDFAADCPFVFQLPSHAEISNKEEACWFDISMPLFKAKIHCSYLPVKNREEFEDLVLDAFEIAERINARANFMEESLVQNEYGVSGLIMEWSGPAASPIHFFLTDTTHHFFKAALYFDSKVKPDSLAPITDYIKSDIQHMISTFTWKE